jgi:hypothetical protein
LTLDEYFADIHELLDKYGVAFEQGVVVWIRNDGKVGRVDGSVKFSDRTYLEVRERVQIDERGRPDRIKYSYYIVLDGAEFDGFDHAPDHPIATHRHDWRDHEKRYADRLRTLEEVIQITWTVASDEDYYAIEGPDLEL